MRQLAANRLRIPAECEVFLVARPSPSDVTRAIADLQQGDREASERLWELVYEELRQLAFQKMSREKGGPTLQPTALVHEAYVRLLGNGDDTSWASRAHFFAAAATAMRRILIDRARSRGRVKRGGDRDRSPLSDVVESADAEQVDLIDLHNALTKLEAIDEEKGAIVTLRYLLGCTIEETAQALGISPAKVKQDWTFARAWLHHELQSNEP